MRSYLTESAEQLSQGGIRAFFDKAAAYKNTINLGIGEPAQHTPEAIIEAAVSAAQMGYTHYSANAGFFDVRHEVASYLKGFDLDYDPEGEIVITCGGMGALALVLSCTVDTGTGVLIQDPQWVNYSSQVRFLGGKVIHVEVEEEENYVLKAEQIRKSITDQTKILLINSPNNPTGAVLSQEELSAIAEVAIENDLLVISDEVYCELVYNGRHHSIASLPGMKERTCVINSFSKSFAMTGWRIGFAAGPRRLIKKMTILQENYFSCANTLGQKAGAYALHTRCGLDEMKESYRRKRDLVCDVLDHFPKVSYSKPEGAFYIFMNISKCGCTSLEMADRLLKETGVITVPGSSFGSKGEGHLRLSYAGSDENLLEALHRMEPLLS